MSRMKDCRLIIVSHQVKTHYRDLRVLFCLLARLIVYIGFGICISVLGRGILDAHEPQGETVAAFSPMPCFVSYTYSTTLS